MSLASLGWSSSSARLFQPLELEGLLPARVLREDRGRYILSRGAGPALRAEVTGRFRHLASGSEAFPAVGDWVGVTCSGTAQARIHGLAQRSSAFVRRAAGSATVAQVVAANVDVALLVSGLDGDLNLRRLERALTAARESGVRPLVVLNKVDLCRDLVATLQAVESVAGGAEIYPISATQGDLGCLKEELVPGRTLVLVGSSGVGKSTLTNLLLEEEVQRTRAVREGDDRGVHTTTGRELFVLPSGALLIDTPGLRELQLWGGDEDGLGGTFADVERLAEACRFTDCQHDGEPGCAVEEALRCGELEAGRLASYRKLQKQLRFVASKRDAREQSSQRKRFKSLTKHYKAVQRENRRRKGL